jgi:hypothetical protein
VTIVETVARVLKKSSSSAISNIVMGEGRFRGLQLNVYTSVTVGPLTEEYLSIVSEIAVRAVRKHVNVAEGAIATEEHVMRLMRSSFEMRAGDHFFGMTSPAGSCSMFFVETRLVELGVQAVIVSATGSFQLAPDLYFVSKSRQSLLSSKSWVGIEERAPSMSQADVSNVMAILLSQAVERPKQIAVSMGMLPPFSFISK